MNYFFTCVKCKKQNEKEVQKIENEEIIHIKGDNSTKELDKIIEVLKIEVCAEKILRNQSKRNCDACMIMTKRDANRNKNRWQMMRQCKIKVSKNKFKKFFGSIKRVNVDLSDYNSCDSVIDRLT